MATLDRPAPFPRVVWVSLLLEFVERLAFYGVYVNLAVYLLTVVHLTPTQNGLLLGWFVAVRSWLPVITGALSDRIGFRRCLVLSFIAYALAYTSLYYARGIPGAWVGVLATGAAGAFLKPVIPATVRRYSPEGREAFGFSMFYASVNAGSVVGKTLTKLVRVAISLRATFVNAIVASVVGLGLALLFFREPKSNATNDSKSLHDSGPESAAGIAARVPETPKPSIAQSFFALARRPRLFVFLALVSGYYLLIEQFYQTFPVHIVRLFGENAPREYITLINPASIALLQVPMAALSKRIQPVFGMGLGIFVGAASMLLMGAWPSLLGACGSFFVFALAEMLFSPRYYQYVRLLRKAPKDLRWGFRLFLLDSAVLPEASFREDSLSDICLKSARAIRLPCGAPMQASECFAH
jgi:proton-dependent oligopeptide transporter, POT family